MKRTFLFLLLAVAPASAQRLLIASNDTGETSVICTTAHGNPVTADGCFVSTGTCTLTDAEISATAATPGGAGSLAAAFTGLGGTVSVGVEDLPGLVEFTAPLGTDAAIRVCVVLHNHASLALSDEILVFRRNLAAGDDITETVKLSGDPADGAVLIGAYLPVALASIPGYAENRPTLRMAAMQRPPYAAWVALRFPPGTPSATLAADADPDGDGINNLAEYQDGLDPNNRDTDGDGIPDHKETAANARSADRDGDGVNDGDEISDHTDPDDYASVRPPGAGPRNHWPFDNAEADNLYNRRLQFSGTGEFTESLDQSARSLAQPMWLEAWQLPTRDYSFGFWLYGAEGDFRVVEVAGQFGLRLPDTEFGGLRLLNGAGTAISSAIPFPSGGGQYVGLVVRGGRDATLYVDGQRAGSVPIGLNSAAAPLVLGQADSPCFMDELVLWERHADARDFNAAAAGAAALYVPPTGEPLKIVGFRIGVVSGGGKAELHWLPGLPGESARVLTSPDLAPPWTTMLTTVERSAILDTGSPPPPRLFFKVEKVGP